MAETSFLHEELMQEEGLSIRDIPIELQRQVKGFNVRKKKYEENIKNIIKKYDLD